MASSEAETGSPTNEPGKLADMARLLGEAEAKLAMAEARLEFALADLQRHRLRLKDYQRMGREWRELLGAVLADLEQEPDGVRKPDLMEYSGVARMREAYLRAQYEKPVLPFLRRAAGLPDPEGDRERMPGIPFDEASLHPAPPSQGSKG